MKNVMMIHVIITIFNHWRIDAFELWCWRRLLRVPWTARRSNQSIPKEISPLDGCSLEGLMLKFKLQYFGHVMQSTNSFEKPHGWERLNAGGEREWERRMRWWMASPTQWPWLWVSSRNWWWTGIPGVLQSMGSHRVGYDWSDLAAAVWSPCSPRDSQESSPTPQFKNINSLALSTLHSPTLASIHDRWKNHSLD